MILLFNLFLVLFTFIPGYYIGVFNFARLNYYLVLFWSVLLFCVIGGFIINSGLMDGTFFVEPIEKNQDAKDLGLFLTTISFLLFFLSIWLTECFYSYYIKRPGLKVDWNLYYSLPVYKKSSVPLLVLLIISILLAVYYVASVYPPPLLMAFQGASPEDIAIRRLDVTKNYDGIGYFKTLATIIPSILSYYLFVTFLIFKTKKNFFIFILSLILSVSILSINGEKAPLIFFFIGLLVAYSSVTKISKQVYLISSLLMSLVIILMYLILFQFDNMDYLIYIIIERLFIAQEIAVFYAVDFFSYHQYLGFSTLDTVFNKVFSITSSPRASELFMNKYLPVMVSNGGWNVNGFFAHETFSNFGYWGIIFGAIYGGIINTIICIFFRNRSKTIVTVSFFCFFTVSVTTVLSSFNSMLFNTQLILVFIFFILVRALEGTMCNAIRKK